MYENATNLQQAGLGTCLGTYPGENAQVASGEIDAYGQVAGLKAHAVSRVPDGELSSRLNDAHQGISSLAVRLDRLADRIAPEPRDIGDGANQPIGKPSLSEKVAGIHRSIMAAESALKRIEAQI